ncbi:hypothetical protein VSH64_43050 [Amycolatopsis rhabdoformis]|uniref:DUF4190 domain-containing protein n=1 Tax=Amycolatopsis rhabdoformis TaxID=1448059 RepID=A0ABZ1I6B7_9PSEU|nr:hypothetical protein [Amycolatopsis rhabdoformis]WSE29511.1 hypothetical protein VSH64_43050 [Amycolatopsis rhabdoformis]
MASPDTDELTSVPLASPRAPGDEQQAVVQPSAAVDGAVSGDSSASAPEEPAADVVGVEETSAESPGADAVEADAFAETQAVAADDSAADDAAAFFSAANATAGASTADNATADDSIAGAPVAAPHRIEPAVTGKPRGRWWRGFTGSIAAGLAVLAVGVLGVEVVCLATGAPGPNALLLIGHPVAAVVALLLQRVADRRYGRTAALAGIGVLLVTFAALTVFWWA